MPGTRACSTCCSYWRACISWRSCSYRLRPGVDLVKPMFTGRKRTTEPAIAGSRLPLAAALLLASAAALWLIVRAAPPPSLADLGIYF
jgi:hypothetical protein